MDTTKTITLGQAFAHCAGTSSYWLWIAITLVLCGACAFGMYKYSQKQELNPYVRIVLMFAIVVAIFACVFLRPTSVCQNTSTAMAARGHFLGY